MFRKPPRCSHQQQPTFHRPPPRAHAYEMGHYTKNRLQLVGFHRSSARGQADSTSVSVETRSRTLLDGGRILQNASMQSRREEGFLAMPTQWRPRTPSTASKLTRLAQALGLERHQCVKLRKSVSRQIDAPGAWWERVKTRFDECWRTLAATQCCWAKTSSHGRIPGPAVAQVDDFTGALRMDPLGTWIFYAVWSSDRAEL